MLSRFKEWKLAHPSVYRTIIQVKCVFLYFVFGCLFYNHYEGWGVLKSSLFTVVTMATVGFGYTHPSDDACRLFTIFYIFGGVALASTIVNSFIESVIKRTTERRMKKYGLQKDDPNAKMHPKWKIVYSVVAMVLCFLIGAGVLCGLEGYTYITALYLTVQTTTTVGYGDIPLTLESTQIFMIFYIILSTLIFAVAFESMGEVQALVITSAEERRKRQNAPDVSWIFEADRRSRGFGSDELERRGLIANAAGVLDDAAEGDDDEESDDEGIGAGLAGLGVALVGVGAGAVGKQATTGQKKAAWRKAPRTLHGDAAALVSSSGQVDMFQFVVAMLVQQGVVDKQVDIDPLLEKFAELDARQCGYIETEAMYNFADAISREQEDELDDLFNTLPMGLVAPIHAASLSAMRSSSSNNDAGAGASSAGSATYAWPSPAAAAVTFVGPASGSPSPSRFGAAGVAPRATSLLARAQARGGVQPPLIDDNYHAMEESL